jgi:3-hydroxyisobutyrate dehydrogenase-like beta-hydroxyacid dehydrogenase
MVARLVGAGHEVVVLARRPEAKADAEAEGFTCADTVAATVRDAEVVVSVVLSDDQVRSVFLGPAGALMEMKPRATVVQHTTCDPATVQLIADEASVKGIRVLDAALSGGPPSIVAGALTLWVGGEEAVLDEMRPLLESYASPVMFVGSLGNGQRVKLVNNALFVAQVGLAVDAVRLASSMGIDEETILAAVQHGSGASFGLSVVAGAGSVDAVGDRLSDLMFKDVTVVREVARRSKTDLGIIGTVLSSDPVEAKVLRSGGAHNPRL